MKAILVFLPALLAAGCHSHAKGQSLPPAMASSASADDVAALTKQVAELDARLTKLEDLLRDALKEAEEDERAPDPQAVYAVPVAGLPFIGPEHAKVTIVEAYEFACGFCYRARPTIDQLRSLYPDDVKVVFAPFIVHPKVAVVPALAACAADEQGKFTEMKARIWDKGFAEKDLGEAKMTALAGELGLDMERFQRDMDGEQCMNQLKNSYQTLSALGLTGTPTFYINGRYLVGAQPLPVFTKLIDEELAKANEAVARGMKVEDYYRKAVLESGTSSL